MPRIHRLIITMLVIIPAVISSYFKHRPKSCFEIKEYLTVTDNGYYTLYDGHHHPYTSYCDFESEPPFIWTLIESFALYHAQKVENQRSFYYDLPVSQCHMTWDKFRLSKVRIQAIHDSYGSTHFRVTCNFNPTNGTGIANNIDYLRGSLCHYSNFYSHGGDSYDCVRVDYINVRGYHCRKCSLPFYGGAAVHQFIDLGTAQNDCDQFNVPDKISAEDVFGHYLQANPHFSCSASPNSTTNWWIGGAYIPPSL